MADRVVDGLEAVQVDKQDCGFCAVALGATTVLDVLALSLVSICETTRLTIEFICSSENFIRLP